MTTGIRGVGKESFPAMIIWGSNARANPRAWLSSNSHLLQNYAVLPEWQLSLVFLALSDFSQICDIPLEDINGVQRPLFLQCEAASMSQQVPNMKTPTCGGPQSLDKYDEAHEAFIAGTIHQDVKSYSMVILLGGVPDTSESIRFRINVRERSCT